MRPDFHRLFDLRDPRSRVSQHRNTGLIDGFFTVSDDKFPQPPNMPILL